MKAKTKTKTKTRTENPFKGADDIYLTKNKIAVTRVQSESTPRGYEYKKKTKYYVKNDKNIKSLKQVTGNVVRKGARGNTYITLK